MLVPGLIALALGTIDGPRVEILASQGSVDGPGGRTSGPPHWDHVRLALEVQNRLTVDVRDLMVDVTLLSSASGKPEPIPGWAFQDVSIPDPLVAGETTTVWLEQALPLRRRSPAASEVSYRIILRSYRVSHPSLPLASELLSSPHPSDQRAALLSFEPAPGWPADQTERIATSMAEALRALPARPSATDALKMLLAVRALGSIAAADQVPLLLALPDRLDREAWGRAVLDLAAVVVAQGSDAPRLLVLPRWARRVATLLKVNARDALEEATREAVLQIGEASVPSLVRIAATSVAPRQRARATALLERMSRATARAQLAVRSSEAKLAVIRVFGEIGSPDRIPALMEVFEEGGPTGRAAGEALLATGAAAIEALAMSLGHPQDRLARDLLARLGRTHRASLNSVATELDLQPERFGETENLVLAIADRRFWDRRTRLEAEVSDAIALGANGAYRAALDRLDAVYREAPDLYARHADPIARLYLARAERFLERGDYYAAIDVLSDGQAVKPLPEAAMRLTDARVALARGFLELGDLGQTSTELNAAPIPTRADVQELRGQWLEASAREALGAGRRGEARRLIDEALALVPDKGSVRLLERRIRLAEHLAEVLALSLTVPALLVFGLVYARRRLEQLKMERLARALDENES